MHVWPTNAWISARCKGYFVKTTGLWSIHFSWLTGCDQPRPKVGPGSVGLPSITRGQRTVRPWFVFPLPLCVLSNSAACLHWLRSLYRKYTKMRALLKCLQRFFHLKSWRKSYGYVNVARIRIRIISRQGHRTGASQPFLLISGYLIIVISILMFIWLI